VYTDGGARGNPGPAGVGVFICNEQGQMIKEASLYLGQSTNNEAEYRAVWFGFETLKKTLSKEKLKQVEVELRLDSELVVKQLRGEYQIKDEKLVPWFMKIWNARVADFPRLRITHVPRAENAEADRLANVAMDSR